MIIKSAEINTNLIVHLVSSKLVEVMSVFLTFRWIK